MKIFIVLNESTRKTCKNTIVICCLAPETSAFEDAGKMAQKMVHLDLTVVETLSKRGQQKQQQFHTHEELFSGQSEVAGNKCRAGMRPEYSKLQ